MKRKRFATLIFAGALVISVIGGCGTKDTGVENETEAAYGNESEQNTAEMDSTESQTADAEKSIEPGTKWVDCDGWDDEGTFSGTEKTESEYGFDSKTVTIAGVEYSIGDHTDKFLEHFKVDEDELDFYESGDILIKSGDSGFVDLTDDLGSEIILMYNNNTENDQSFMNLPVAGIEVDFAWKIDFECFGIQKDMTDTEVISILGVPSHGYISTNETCPMEYKSSNFGLDVTIDMEPVDYDKQEFKVAGFEIMSYDESLGEPIS